jgi:hypothetical protein
MSGRLSQANHFLVRICSWDKARRSFAIDCEAPRNASGIFAEEKPHSAATRK